MIFQPCRFSNTRWLTLKLKIMEIMDILLLNVTFPAIILHLVGLHLTYILALDIKVPTFMISKG